MLPVQDVLPSRSTPWITGTIVVVLAAVLAGVVLMPEPLARGLIVSYGLVPAHLSWPTLFSSMLLQRGIVDFAFNAGALWVFGDNVEDRLGRGRYLVLAGTAALSGLIVARTVPDVTRPLVGAAGLAGVVAGAHLALLPRSRILMLVPIWRGIDLVELPAALVILLWLTAGGLVGGVWSPPPALPLTLLHQLAGLAIGAVGGRLLVRRSRLRCEWWNVPARYSPDRVRTSRETTASSVSKASS